MLGKLIKYEFKATGRLMLLMYGLLIAMSGMISLGLFFNLDEILNRFAGRFAAGGMILIAFIFLFAVLFAVLTAVVICGMFFYAISRFKNNLLGDEGYLTHTLPVKLRDNILAKGIVSLAWTLAGFAVAAAAYLIIFIGIRGTNFFKDSYDFIVLLSKEYEQIGWLPIAAEFFLIAIAALVNIYFEIYASMAAGFSSNTHRIAKSIGVFILLKIAENIFEVLTTSPLRLLFGIEITSFANNVHAALWYGIVITVIETVCCYFITHYFLSKKLNLQ